MKKTNLARNTREFLEKDDRIEEAERRNAHAPKPVPWESQTRQTIRRVPGLYWLWVQWQKRRFLANLLVARPYGNMRSGWRRRCLEAVQRYNSGQTPFVDIPSAWQSERAYGERTKFLDRTEDRLIMFIRRLCKWARGRLDE